VQREQRVSTAIKVKSAEIRAFDDIVNVAWTCSVSWVGRWEKRRGCLLAICC